VGGTPAWGLSPGRAFPLHHTPVHPPSPPTHPLHPTDGHGRTCVRRARMSGRCTSKSSKKVEYLCATLRGPRASVGVQLVGIHAGAVHAHACAACRSTPARRATDVRAIEPAPTASAPERPPAGCTHACTHACTHLCGGPLRSLASRAAVLVHTGTQASTSSMSNANSGPYIHTWRTQTFVRGAGKEVNAGCRVCKGCRVEIYT
jgi:hypothetical protein